MADRNTVEQVESVIGASFVALEAISAALAERDTALYVIPTAMFLPFAARSQLLRQTPAEQLAWVNQGLALAGQVLAARASAQRFGRGRRPCPVTLEMAQTACELAKKAVDECALAPNRKAARDTLLYRSLLEFCVMAKILEPANLGQAMSIGNEKIAEVIASGWLTRNEIKIR